jgi:hypothetical protein
MALDGHGSAAQFNNLEVFVFSLKSLGITLDLAWNSLAVFVGFGTFQWVRAVPNKIFLEPSRRFYQTPRASIRQPHKIARILFFCKLFLEVSDFQMLVS